jgi:D-lactate dehydrogenase
MQIIFDEVEPEARAHFERELAGHTLTFLDVPLAQAKFDDLKNAEALSVFVSSPVTPAIIGALPALKFITARSMGYDHIDLTAAKGRGISVANVPVYGSNTVAEFAFALILALSRKAYAAYDRLRSEGTTDVKDFEGFNLAGKTIGVIGTGNIGKNVARIARGFGMKISAFDMRPDEKLVLETGCAYKSLEDVVAESDIITIHVPYFPSTHHLIDARILALCKKGSFLINTARGAIIDTRALVDAVKSGQLAGVGLDVVEGEHALLDELSLLTNEHQDINEFQQLVAAHALLGMPQVIMTPHIAFNTKEAKHEITEITAKNILAFVSGTPQNVVKV